MRIITLIHGTWARGARWTQDDSPLVVALRAADPEARIKPLEWSGRNSHAARLQAAEKLVHRIRGVRRRHPAAKHYVIAHSHGGNVVRYALSVDKISASLDGVVCLSTPFIICWRKPESKELWDRVIRLFFVGGVALLIVITNLSQRTHSLGISWILGDILMLVMFLVPFAAIFLFYLLMAKLGRGIYIRWPIISRRWLIDSFEGGGLSPDKFRIIRPTSDEADMGLKFFQLLALLSSRPGKWLDRLYVNKDRFISFVFGMNPKLRLGVAVLTGFAACAFSRVWVAQLMKHTAHGGGLLLFFGAVTATVLSCGLCICFWLAVAGYKPGKVKVSSTVTADMDAPYEIFAMICNAVLSLFFFPLIAITSLFTVAFGWDMPFFSVFLQFSVEPLPPGAFSVFQLRPQDIPGLSHSQPYNNPVAILEIIRWMESHELESRLRELEKLLAARTHPAGPA